MTLHERFSCCVFFVAQIYIVNQYPVKIMTNETNVPKPHIVLCAPKKTGKTMLIERIMQEAKSPASESPMPVYGFQTKRFAGPDGINRIYMFPAGRVQTDSATRKAHYIGSTRDGVRDICTETFDIFGTSLIESARPGGLLIMDEIGHMEKDASRFLRAVFEALDDDIPILASVRYTTTPIDYLERIKHHPRVRLYTLTEENRDDAYAEIRDRIFGGGAGRKEEIDHETL